MDDLDDEDTSDLFVSFSTTFKTIRVIGHKFIPTTFKLKSDVIYDLNNDELDDDHQFKVQIAMAKVRYWFENIVSNSIMVNRSNEWAMRAFLNAEGKQDVENSLIVLPGSPTEDRLAQVFQSKMNALANMDLTFGFIELTADDANGLSFVFTGDSECYLPGMDEWVGEHSFFSRPWWARNDASTIDVIPDEDADLNDPPAFAYSLDFLGDFIRPASAPSARIIRPEFRPTVIKGGVDD